ncbi:MAG: formylmethanofuran dehydrogenase subunit E [Rhodoplanes sp.]|uniref:formylmethanofuran dehydrogenase subunit E family protein n=1 Tax=Rhodoplanes sp. TaxID=1968906 RepID=UPI0017CFCBF0|nr:formylmethanofuran dehydrogenase subunit E family protein [Rhodoplanes sp.]NVO13296.1 formylmethanofuran dehydrogenase subunit E [Rhodoplanes sp.]
MVRSGRIATIGVLAAALLAAGLVATPAHDGPIEQTPPDERDLWVSLGARIHGGFGSLIAVGIRIGDDARQKLGAAPRELDVTYFTSPEAPCPCVVDGVMVATRASPGQASLRVADAPAGAGLFGRVTIRHKPSGRVLEYAVPAAIWPRLRDINKEPTGTARWNAVMAIPAAELMTVREEPVAAAQPAKPQETKP